MDIDITMMLVAGGSALSGLVGFLVYYFRRSTDKQSLQNSEAVTSEASAPVAPENLSAPAAELAPAPGFAPSPAHAPTSAPPAPVARPIPKDLTSALANTRASLFGRIKGLFTADHDLSADDREALEEILYTSDLGPKTVQRLLDAVDESLSHGQKSDLEAVRRALSSEILKIFSFVHEEPINGEARLAKSNEDVSGVLHLTGNIETKPLVWLIVGVNGVGKTTTIGKLANAVAKSGKKVVVAAGDTFRAAAGEQLKIWSERAQVEIFSPPGITDPSAVAFDACQMAKARGFDVVIIDTAGRLHTQTNLMEELHKMKRVVQKVVPNGPHEILLVLDANSGQNALVQARNFHDILKLSGVVLTKMDGTAKGGVAVGLACELELPIRLIGVGEGIDDLRPFCSKEFVNSIL